MHISFSRLLSGIVQTPTEQKNFFNDTARNLFTGLLPIFASVSIMQAFVLENGVSSSSIGVFNTVSNACSVVGMLAVMSAADNLTGRRLVRTMTLSNFPAMIMPLLMFFLSLAKGSLTGGLFFGLSALAFAANSIALNVRSIFATKMQRFIYRERSYGTAFGISGLIFYLTALLASFTVKPLLLMQEGYSILFALASLSVLGAAFFNSRLIFLDESRDSAASPDASPSKVKLSDALKTIFSERKLRFSIYLHFGRGIVNAFVFCFVLIGSHYFNMQLSGAAYLTMITTFASIAAYVLVTALYNKLGSVFTALFSLGLCAIGAALMLILQSVAGFYAAVALFQIGNIFYSQIIPLACFKITPPKALGSFTVVRIVLMQSVEAAATLLFSAIVEKTEAFVIIVPVLAAVAFQMACCVLAYRKIPSEANCLHVTLKLKRRK